MEIHVIRRLEDWLSKLKPAARARVTAYVVDRARQLDHEEKEAAYREQLQHTGVAQRTSPEFLRGLG
jgi:transcription elongation GreA/GreB family factor